MIPDIETILEAKRLAVRNKSLSSIMFRISQVSRIQKYYPFDTGKLERAYAKEAKLLYPQVESGNLARKDVRKAIRKVMRNAEVPCGIAQKPINVLLKYYAFARAPAIVLKELDCPIDSKVRNAHKEFREWAIPLYKMDFTLYKKWQDFFWENYGARILADVYE